MPVVQRYIIHEFDEDDVMNNYTDPFWKFWNMDSIKYKALYCNSIVSCHKINSATILNLQKWHRLRLVEIPSRK